MLGLQKIPALVYFWQVFCAATVAPRDIGYIQSIVDDRGIIGYLMAGIVGAVMLVLGPVITFSIRNGISTSGWSTAQNTTMTNLDNNISTAWTIGALSLLVVFAAGIIKTLRGSF